MGFRLQGVRVGSLCPYFLYDLVILKWTYLLLPTLRSWLTLWNIYYTVMLFTALSGAVCTAAVNRLSRMNRAKAGSQVMCFISLMNNIKTGSIRKHAGA